MKYFVRVFIFFISINSLWSQSNNYIISGKISANDTKVPLESATVYLERVKDSSVITYTISDKSGQFKIESSTFDKQLNLYISYIGYAMFKKKIKVSETPIHLGDIFLSVDTNQLGEVVLQSRAPITVKKDTLEFNVKSFKTKKNANVEDLLKQLPGVEVNDKGEITINGKPVNKILVNGKPFFGDDPTITTRNLSKELIEKVQIVDTKTKSEAFSGEEGDKQNKTINLTITKEKNKGIFGRTSAGGGTDDRWELAGIVNIFDNNRRFSVLAGGNNTNSPGFSFGEIQKMFGRGNSMSISSGGSFSIDNRSFGGGEGIVTSKNIGSNYVDELSQGVDLSADYFYSESTSENDTKTERENIFPDTRFFTNSESRNTSTNRNHTINTSLDIKLDSTFLVNIRPDFEFGNRQSTNQSEERSFNENQEQTNSSNLNELSISKIKNFNNTIDVTKRFGNKGSFLKFNVQTQFDQSNSETFLNSETDITDPTQTDIIRNQRSNNTTDFSSLRLSSTYRLPLIPKIVFLNFKLNHLSNKRIALNRTFDFNNSTTDFTDFNTELSTDFTFNNKRTTPSLDISIRKEKWSISFDAGYVFRTLENRDQLRPALSLKQNFEALELGSNFNLSFNDKTSMYGGYSLSNRPPQLRQIQPFQNVSNPLNTVIGNPNLEPENVHSFYTGFSSYNFQKKTNFYSYVNYNLTNNQIVTNTEINNDFVSNTTYTNVQGNYRVSVNSNYSKTIKLDSLRTLKIGISAFANHARNVRFNNAVQLVSKNTRLSPRINLTFNWKDILRFSPSYSISYSKNTFNRQNFNTQEFVQHGLRLNSTTTFPKKIEWQNNISFNYNPNVADGFQKSIWFWNTTLAYSLLKDKATLTLKIYDLLQQNNNTRRVATATYIQDTQSTVLQQFFMLSFSYKFNSLGEKGKIKENVFFF